VCEPHGTDFSWLELKKIPTKELMQTGVVTANACGKFAASPVPGQLIIFVRPLNLWGCISGQHTQTQLLRAKLSFETRTWWRGTVLRLTSSPDAVN
jgi:hypothetical protein